MKNAILNFDGGAQPNPGQIGIGCIVRTDNRTWTDSQQLGHGTNNEAEYRALICGLELAREEGCTSLEVAGDSELIVRQVQGEYDVNESNLRRLRDRVMSLVDEMDEFTIHHVPREANQRADKLADQALSK